VEKNTHFFKIKQDPKIRRFMTNDQINIFYTDDDRDDLIFFKDAVGVASKEINVVTTFDGGTLLNLLNNPPPEPAIIFLDWNMPGQTGAEVLKEIRANDKTSQVPVIIFSTSDSMTHIEHSRQLGANMYITKPSSFQGIVKVLKHCFTINWKTFVAGKDNFVYKNA
jgi:DNA-binding response OmpR family regulator